MIDKSLTVVGTGDSNVTVKGDGIGDKNLSNVAFVVMPTVGRQDGQSTLKLSSLNVSQEELEKALNDSLFLITSESMTNRKVSYRNRPKRSESLVKVE